MLQPKPVTFLIFTDLLSTICKCTMYSVCNLPVVCLPLPDAVTCSGYKSFLIAEGNAVYWECQLSAPPSTNFNLLINDETILPSQSGVRYGSESQLIFLVQEEGQHVCFSRFSSTVFIYSANEGVVGNFSIINSTGGVVAGINITVELIPEPLPTQGIYYM